MLRQRLRLLEELLSKAMESGDVLAQIQEPILETQVSFKRNLDKVYEKTWDLEQTYRTLGEMMRSASAGISQELELYLLNMSTEDLVKSQALSGQLRHFVLDRADALKKDEAFTAIIAPGGASSPESIEILGKLAERAGLVLFTDIPDLANLDKIKEFLSVDLGNPSGDKPYLNHVALFANYPRIAHARDGELGDEFGMYLPPTAFVVGRYYNNAVSGNLVDSIAGLKDNFKNATGTRVFINQTKSADAQFADKFHVNPVINEGHDKHRGAVAFGHKTLCNKDGTCVYPITYTKTFIGRCIAHRLALFMFKKIDDFARSRIEDVLQDFLNLCVDRGWITYGSVSVVENKHSDSAFDVILKLQFAKYADTFNLQISAELQRSGQITSGNINEV
ncbi:MAG: hypothetical protein IPM94_13395 [bacterium]|nr:hypothetical protein [bacterium]